MSYKITLCGILMNRPFAIDNLAAFAMSPTGNQRQRDTFLDRPLQGKREAPLQMVDAVARPDGVRLTTTWPTPMVIKSGRDHR